MCTLRLVFSLFFLLFSGACYLQGGYETTTPVPGNTSAWLDRHEQINELARQGNIDLVFLGDSITDMWSLDGVGKAVWDEYYGHRNAANFGISGDRTQHVLWRVENGNFDGIDPRLIILLIGTNNLEDNSSWHIAAGVRTIVKKLREMQPRAKIVLLGIFPRGAHADSPFRAKIRQTNGFFKSVADGRTVVYLDVGNVFLDDAGGISSAMMPDYLHLSEPGYRLWAEMMEPTIQKMLDE